MLEELRNLIEKEQQVLNSINSQNDKMEHINNIIQIKLQIKNKFPQERIDIYTDLKEFIKSYLFSREENKFGYDKLDFSLIYKYINELNLNERVNILKFTHRLLVQNSYEEESKEIETKLNHTEIKYCLKNNFLKNFFKLFYLLSTYNIFTIVTIIFFIIFIGWLMLLPAPGWSVQIFKTEMSNYSNNIALNTLLNMLNGLLEIDNNFKVIPINIFSAFFLLVSKFFIIIFVINILIKELTNKILK